MTDKKDKREMFTGIFEKYEPNTTQPVGQKTHFSEIRSREGGIVTRHLVFNEEISFSIPKVLSIGEYVAFLADVEFKNVEFMNILGAGGVKL